MACTICKHQTINVYGSLLKLTVNLRDPSTPGREKMALRRITIEGIYVSSAGGIATIECDAFSLMTIYYGVQKQFLEVFPLRTLQGGGRLT